MRGARAAQAGPSSALSGAVRATRGAARAVRHSPRQAVQRHCSLANVAHRSRRLPTKQQSAAPACSGRCGAAAPSPRPVHGAGARRHGPPPVAGGAHLPKEAPDAPSAHAALRRFLSSSQAGFATLRGRLTPRAFLSPCCRFIGCAQSRYCRDRPYAQYLDGELSPVQRSAASRVAPLRSRGRLARRRLTRECSTSTRKKSGSLRDKGTGSATATTQAAGADRLRRGQLPQCAQ